MSIKIKRKEREPIGLFLKRFSEKIKRSGLLEKHKEGRFRDKPKGKRVLRKQILRRIKFREKIAYLRKIGKIKEK